MASLTGQTIAATYHGILKTAGDNVNIPTGGTGVNIVDGEETVTALYLTDGEVGIGTATPATQLDVAGDPARIRLTSSDATLESLEVVGALEWYTSDSGGAGVNGKIDVVGRGVAGIGAMRFHTGPQATLTNWMTMTHTGLGVAGIDFPPSPLSVCPIYHEAGTASQSGTTVTGSGTTFIAAHIGSILIYADGVSGGVITARASNTSITVSTDQTISSQGYKIHHQGLQVSTAGTTTIDAYSSTYAATIKNWKSDDNGLLVTGGSSSSQTALKVESHGGSDLFEVGGGGFVGIGAFGASDNTHKLTVVTAIAGDYVAKFFNDGNTTNRYGIRIDAGEDTLGTDADARWIGFHDGDGTEIVKLQYVHSGSTAALVSSSDERLKENINDTSIDGLAAINSLQFREFNWIENSGRGQAKIPIGLIAQEVESAGDKCSIVAPFSDELELKDGTMIEDVKGMGDSGILLYLAKAVQELSAKVTALENA